jgi:hypothetical protein
MKNQLLQLFFLLSINTANGQKIKNIARYHHYYDKENDIVHFKVKSNSFAFTKATNDSTEILFIGNKDKLICPKDSMFMLEVYDERYLFVSFFPIQDAHLAYGVDYRPKDRLLIIDLKKPHDKWLFSLRKLVKTADIKKFDAKTGELSISRKIKGKKNGE